MREPIDQTQSCFKTTLEEDQVSEIDLDQGTDHVRAMALHFEEKLLHAGDFQEAFHAHPISDAPASGAKLRVVS